MIYRVEKEDRSLIGTITLDGSKSISNRALIIRALCPEFFEIKNLSTSKDTRTLDHLLAQKASLYDTGAAGTTFRFLTAYLAMQPETQTLTGSARMKQRPIGVLAKALNQLGANIEFLEKEGYPPLKINAPNLKASNQLAISAGTSSQFISALLMIAPTLPNGLELTLEGTIVSVSYIEMTLALMKYFGIEYRWGGQVITVPPQVYQAKDFTVEADWSAASYYYGMAAFADNLDLELKGLFERSLQGDAIISEMLLNFGIVTKFRDGGIHLSKANRIVHSDFQWNFIKCPDIAQTLAVICGGLGVNGSFSGLRTLKIKETNRVAALQQELAKVGVSFAETPSNNGVNCKVSGKAAVTLPRFATYEDHRMAMAFAPLAMYAPLEVEHPMVVEKSYPVFWEDLKKLGFKVSKV